MADPGELVKQTSIIVCTIDRLQDLARCMESLQAFRSAGAEIIVVDNGPLHTAVEEIARRHHARITIEPRRGVSRARNAGIRAAAGSVLAFLDDDSVADSHWLPLLLAPLQDSRVAAVVGIMEAQSVADEASHALDRLHRAQFPLSRQAFGAPIGKDLFPLRFALIGNATMAIRRETFERFGLFDTRFGRGARIGSGEEPDLLVRFLLGGQSIVAEPAAKIFHRHSTEWRGVQRWAFYSGCGHTAILAKYFLQRPELRGAILRYVLARLRRRGGLPNLPAMAPSPLPRGAFLLGSLYGPLAFLVSGQNPVE